MTFLKLEYFFKNLKFIGFNPNKSSVTKTWPSQLTEEPMPIVGILIGTIATYFAEYIQKNKWIGYVGLVVILIVAIQLIIGGLNDYGVLSINETFRQYF